MSDPKSKASPQHSPLPWRVAVAHSTQGEHRYIHSASYDQTGNSARFDSISSEDASPLSREKWDANAQLIVQAVNSHEANEAKLEVARELAELLVSATTDGTRPLTVLDQRRLMQTAGVSARKFQEMDRENKKVQR